jgi:ligand-binding sensor domain-containing protein/signal transduction histidine kinase
MLLLLAPLAAAAASAGDDFVVDAWRTDAGLPHNSVNAILQTRDGYLWLGTSNGLARFDGVRFATFRAMDHPGLRSNRILCLGEDRDGILWAGTEEGGLVRYEKDQFTSLTSADGLASDTILCVKPDGVGGLWVGTDAELNHAKNGRVDGFFQAEALADDPVYALCQSHRSPLLLATPKGLYQLRQDRAVPYEAPGIAAVRGGIFRCLYADYNQGLWAGGESGLIRLNPSGPVSVVPASKLGNATIMALIRSRDNTLWAGTSAGELYQVMATPGSVDVRLVWQFRGPVAALCEDQERNLWVGTTDRGLYRLKRRQVRWVPFAEGPGGAVSSIFETAGGDLCLLAANNDLYRCQDGKLLRLPSLPLGEGVVVQTVCATGRDELWLGTRSDGLLHCAGGRVRQFSEREGLSDSRVSVLCASPEGGLWVGTRNGGLNYLSGQKVTRYNTPWGFTGAAACALVLDSRNTLWIGTSGDGLYRLSEGRFFAHQQTNGLPGSHVGALLADADQCLWIGTSGGLCRMKAGRITVFPGPNRQTREATVQLRGDAEGNLWVGTSGGLYRFRKEQLNDYADGVARLLDVVAYGKEDGLPLIQCAPQVQSPGLPGRASGLWFAAAKGLVVSDGPSLRWNTVPPPVLLEGVFIENEPVPLSELIRIPPGKRSLRFQFTALSLTAPGKVAFRYQLEGLDQDWSEVTDSRSARYPEVAPGHYRFRVVARNNDGVWNETGASVALVVTPFWWQTAWFRFGLVAAAALALGGLYRLRQLRRREIERLRARIASDLHDDVGSSLWSITLLSRMLVRQGYLRPDDQQDVAEIHRIAVQTSSSIRDIIWLINPAFDSLQDLILRIKDAAGTMLRGTDCHFQFEGIDLTRKLPQDFRQNLFFLFKEALTNVAKHAHATRVEVQIEEQAGRWHFVIRDNGAGFDPNAETAGNGLKNLRLRAAKMRATLAIQSQRGQGTTLTLTTDRQGLRR